MQVAVTYEGGVTRDPTDLSANTLFAGQKLWFSLAVPQRKWFIENAEANGAVIVRLEQQADIVLVDHTKKNAPPGSYSYRYVELSIRNGRLEILDDHIVGSASRADRPVGSVRTAPKSSRTPYTEADDQLLWNWVQPFMEIGGAWKGNEIYKQLEKHNRRHTFQSWRDRWIKITQFQNRQVTSHIGPAYEDEEVNEVVEQHLQSVEKQATGDSDKQAALVVPEEPAQSPQTPAVAGQPKKVDEVEGIEQDHHSVQVKPAAPPVYEEGLLEPRANSSAVRTTKPPAMGNEQSTPTDHPSTSRDGTGSQYNSSQRRALQAEQEKANKNEEQENNVKAELVATDGISDQEPLPVVGDITQKEAFDLFQETKLILGANAENVMRGFQMLTDATKKLNAREWRSYFQRTIVREYQSRHGLGDDEEFAALVEGYTEKMRAWKKKLAQQNPRKTQQGIEQSIPQPVGEVKATDAEPEERSSRLQCAHCYTRETPKWRKDVQGHLLCDSCGRLFTVNSGTKPSATRTEPLVDGSYPEDAHNGEANDNSDLVPPPRVQSPKNESVKSPIHRPPEPNESRKRSQGTSTHSGSQSQTKSQSTTTSGTGTDIPYRADDSQLRQQDQPLASTETESNHTEHSTHRTLPKPVLIKRGHSNDDAETITSPKRQKADTQIGQSQRERIVLSMSSSSSNGDEENEDRSMSAAVSQNEPSQAIIQETGLIASIEAIHQGELSLFLPEVFDNDQDVGSDSRQSADLADDSDSNLPFVDLLHDETQEDDVEDYSSQYAPSEAPSEGLPFDTSPELSQAWATGPQSYEKDSELHMTNGVEPATATQTVSDVAVNVATNHSVNSATADEHETQSDSYARNGLGKSPSDFETAPEAIPQVIESLPESNSQLQMFETARETSIDSAGAKHLGQGEKIDEDNMQIQERLDTQALLQASLDSNIDSNMFMLPPPEGGWGDDYDDDNNDNGNHNDDDEIRIIDERKFGESEKTPPPRLKQEVPDSQARPGRYTSPKPASTTDDSEDMEQWLERQQQIHSAHNIERKLIQNICSRALEATCLETSAATSVVASMISRYTKGKYQIKSLSTSSLDGSPAPNSSGRKKLKRKEKAQLIEILVPEHERGVWTAQDDEWLTGTDARKVHQVEEKHGEAWIKKRFEYLENLYKP